MSDFPVPPDRRAALVAIRDANKGGDASSQARRLLEALRRLGSVTTFECSRVLDIYHPPARKRDLVKAGHAIATLRRAVTTESGRRHWVGLYLLAQVQGDA